MTIRTIIRFALVAGLILALAACVSSNRKPEYYDAVEAPPLEIPEGMDSPQSSVALTIDYPKIPLPAMEMVTMPPRISSTTSGIDANSSLNWSAQGMYLLIDDSFDSAERRANLVIERSGMKKITRDDQGVWRFEYYQVFGEADGSFWDSMAFWRRGQAEDYSGAYQVYLRPDGEQTRVYIKYADGTDCEPDAAEHVLAVLGARLG